MSLRESVFDCLCVNKLFVMLGMLGMLVLD